LEITITGESGDSEALRELLSRLDVSFTTPEQAEVEVVCGQRPSETRKSVVVPRDRIEFVNWARDIKLNMMRVQRERVPVAISSQATLNITPLKFYSYCGLSNSKFVGADASQIRLNDDLVVLKFDIVYEYYKILRETLEARSAFTYRLLTGLPLPYNLAPKGIRDLLMTENDRRLDLLPSECLPLDALRFVIAHALENLSNKRLVRKRWNGKRYSCALTHDVDTLEGLRNAGAIKKLEEKYDVPSAWFIPSRDYKLHDGIVRPLANHGEIGAHDTKHDGKLFFLSKQKLVKRLCEAKCTLERIADCSIEGFRAPLLQHSLPILEGIQEAGYKYDSSIPAWEPKHPRTMRPHGLGTVYPMHFGNIVEIPITLVQDHQMLSVLGLKPREAIARWLSAMALIKELNGCCVFLSHPEYKILDRDNLSLYEELLTTVVSDGEAWLSTPNHLAKEVEQ
jgi:hypothetical protein